MSMTCGHKAMVFVAHNILLAYERIICSTVNRQPCTQPRGDNCTGAHREDRSSTQNEC